MTPDAGPWAPAPTEETAAFAVCGADEPAELRDVRVLRARLSVPERLDRLQAVNVELVDCDISGLVTFRSRGKRLLLRGTRLRGVMWADGILEDLTLTEVTGSDVSARFSVLRRVTFRDCELPGLDLTESTLERVRFERCDLRGARFEHASVKSLRLAGCDLAGLTGARWLAGASVHPADLISLGPSLAEGLGLTVE